MRRLLIALLVLLTVAYLGINAVGLASTNSSISNKIPLLYSPIYPF